MKNYDNSPTRKKQKKHLEPRNIKPGSFDS